jgi:hypothetical protein
MESNWIDHVLAIGIVLAVIATRLLVPEALTGDLVLVTALVFAAVVDGPVVLTVLAAIVLWLSLYPGMLLAILLIVILTLIVYLSRYLLTSRWRPWALSAICSVAGTLIFNGVLHHAAALQEPRTVALATGYALLYSIVLFGILREIYVRQKR